MDRAISGFRDAVRSHEPALSHDRRAAIVEAAFSGRVRVAPAPSLFLTTRRWVLAGVIPVMALGAFLALGPALRDGKPTAQPRITVSKDGGEVVFTVANGTRHRVAIKSTSPQRFNPAAAIPITNGSFRDTVNDGSELIFYRID